MSQSNLPLHVRQMIRSIASPEARAIHARKMEKMDQAINLIHKLAQSEFSTGTEEEPEPPKPKRQRAA